MPIALAWRNLWRNPRRTLITVLSLTIGVAAIITIHSYRESAYGQIIRNLTTGMLGHLQVHGAGWQHNPELGLVVPDPKLVEATLATKLPGSTSVKRVTGYGLAGAGENSTGVVVLGIEPAPERAGTALLTIKAGRDLADLPSKQAVLGLDLAAQLGVQPGGELVLLGEAVDGSVANDRYTVVGIADAGSSELNGTAVFLHLADAQDFFGLGAAVHQIIVKLPSDDQDVSGPVATLRAALDVTTLEAVGWNEIIPEFKGAMDQKRKGQRVIDLIVFLIVALGVLNAMTMSTLERTRELGVLASLGTRRGRLLRMIVLEAVLQGAVGFVAGFALAAVSITALGELSFASFSQQDMMGVRFPATILLSIHWPAVASAAFVAFATVVAGGLFPAWRASRMRPVEATRYA